MADNRDLGPMCFYVDPAAGRDGNSGAIDAPFQTLDRAPCDDAGQRGRPDAGYYGTEQCVFGAQGGPDNCADFTAY